MVSTSARTLQEASTAAAAAAVAAVAGSLSSGGSGGVQHLFRRPAMSESALATLLRKAQLKASPHISALDAELVRASPPLPLLPARRSHAALFALQ